MCATKLHNGTATRNTKDILKFQSNFYAKLYTLDNNVRFTPPKYELPKISEEVKENLDSEITLQELGIAILEMKNSCSPGLD